MITEWDWKLSETLLFQTPFKFKYPIIKIYENKIVIYAMINRIKDLFTWNNKQQKSLLGYEENSL